MNKSKWNNWSDINDLVFHFGDEQDKPDPDLSEDNPPPPRPSKSLEQL
jgi:hypothetical protein